MKSTGEHLIGQMLAQYRIEAKIGQGGMGEVYRALDTQLRRPAAIKLVDVAGDASAEKRARFLAEARAAAGLNHPNIVTIYEIGHSGEHDYIAMELVPGENLRTIIQRGPLELADVLSYGIQIADGVAAAHAAGITHRDLKPANFMVTEQGRLKILDFGIAKRLDRIADEGSTVTLAVETQRGTAVGTPHYMSPEQARGKKVDGRSDIFAIGATLFEMLTGHYAFAGDSMASIMAAILTAEPPAVSSIRPVPDELDRVVARCLRKDLERRLQHAGDLKIALEEIRAEAGKSTSYSGTQWAVARAASPTVTSAAAAAVGAGAHSAAASSIPTLPATAAGTGVQTPLPPGTTHSPTVTHSAPPPARRWVAAAALGLLGTAAAGVGLWTFTNRPTPDPFAQAELKRITADSGLATWPALSRDGKFIAYASDRGDQKHLHIWVQQLGGGQPNALTTGEYDDTEPEFSADGTRIVFHSKREGGGIYSVPTMGGEPRLLARYGQSPRFSPDGRRLAFWAGREFRGRLFLLGIADGTPPEPFQPQLASAQYPIWSPDGQSLLFESATDSSRDWFVASVAGGAPRNTGLATSLRKSNIFPQSPAAWLPGNRLLFSALQNGVGSLWTIPFSPDQPQAAGTPQRLTFGTSIDVWPAAALGTAPKVAFSSQAKKVDLWMLPMQTDRGQVTGELIHLVPGAGTESNQLTISRDGRRIAFFSDRDGEPQPWVRDLVTGRQTSVAKSGTMWAPSISPDGRALAWSLFERGKPQRTLRATIGESGQLGPPELLCQGCGPVVSWAPDGRSVVYSPSSPSRAVFLDLETGKSYPLLEKKGVDVWGGRFSPDGRWLTMNLTESPTRSQVFIAPFDPERRGPVPESEWIPITDGTNWDDKSRWSPNSQSIYFISERDGFRCIWRQALDPVSRRPAGPATSVAHFHQTRLSLSNVAMGPLSFQVAPDKLIFSLGELTGNIWMLSAQAGR